jgi:hypothetical protein
MAATGTSVTNTLPVAFRGAPTLGTTTHLLFILSRNPWNQDRGLSQAPPSPRIHYIRYRLLQPLTFCLSSVDLVTDSLEPGARAVTGTSVINTGSPEERIGRIGGFVILVV